MKAIRAGVGFGSGTETRQVIRAGVGFGSGTETRQGNVGTSFSNEIEELVNLN